MPRRGFSILEILVVIAIIAVLISLAIVGLANTRRSSRTLQCQIQLRQVGAALDAMRDRDGLLPSMKPPVGANSKSTFIDMHLEFMQRWYAAAGATLTPSSDPRLTSAGWSVWESPPPWRCPHDEPVNPISAAWLESLGYDPRWSLAAQVATSYDYIAESPSYAALVRGKADEASMRRVLTHASSLYPRAPLLVDAVPFHQQRRGQAKASDTNAYFSDGSVAVMSQFVGSGPFADFQRHVRYRFAKH